MMSDAGASKSSRKTWISVLIAAVIIVGVLALTAVGGTIFFFSRHISTRFTAPENADIEFAKARSRFPGQTPLIEIRKDEEPVLHRELASNPGGHEKPIESLRVLAYDTRANKLVRVSIPVWLLRMAPSKHLSFLNDNGID